MAKTYSVIKAAGIPAVPEQQAILPDAAAVRFGLAPGTKVAPAGGPNQFVYNVIDEGNNAVKPVELTPQEVANLQPVDQFNQPVTPDVMRGAQDVGLVPKQQTSPSEIPSADNPAAPQK